MSSYIYGLGRQPMNISETEIRYAMSNTKTCSGAARFLRVSYDTFKKYATLYKDEATGKHCLNYIRILVVKEQRKVTVKVPWRQASIQLIKF